MTTVHDLPVPILVVGGYGYRNVGDEAILAGLLDLLGNRRVTVVSRAPIETAAMHRVRAVGVPHAVGELRRHRTVLIGGGGLFGTDVGALGRLLPAFGLWASGLGRQVALVGIGLDAGPSSPFVQRLAQRSALLQVRDGASAGVLGEWGITAEVAPDLSSTMAPAQPAVGAALLRAAGVRLARPVVGLALTGIDRELGQRTVDALDAVMDALPEVQFCFVPMGQHPFVADHNDLLMAHRLKTRQPRLLVLDGVHHPAAILSVFGHLGAVVGMRYHAMLFADRAGVPLVPVAYAPKTRAWLAEHGQSSVEATPVALSEALQQALGGDAPAAARRAAS